MILHIYTANCCVFTRTAQFVNCMYLTCSAYWNGNKRICWKSQPLTLDKWSPSLSSHFFEVVIHLENGKSSREIAQIMGVGRTQIQTINKRKAEIREDYENNISSDRKRKRHKTGNEEINELCWTWFQDAVQRRMNP